MRGWAAGTRVGGVTPTAVSETPAAVTRAVSGRPRVSQPRWRSRPMIRFPASVPWREVYVGGGLDGLGVQHAGRRLRASALGFADQAPQQAGEPLEDAVLLPLGEVPVHRGPRREVVREAAPGDAGAVHVQGGLDQFPAGVRQAAGTGAVRSHVCDAVDRGRARRRSKGGARGRVGSRQEQPERNDPQASRAHRLPHQAHQPRRRRTLETTPTQPRQDQTLSESYVSEGGDTHSGPTHWITRRGCRWTGVFRLDHRIVGPACRTPARRAVEPTGHRGPRRSAWRPGGGR
ncbi:hypothetical protein OK074_2852 [Actinobacteria bacterium OK074]|nr:hypothetical protein OK074_2852 [Actinobacteria bacterium OK074]